LHTPVFFACGILCDDKKISGGKKNGAQPVLL